MKCECVIPWMNALIYSDSVGVCCWQIVPPGKINKNDTLQNVLVDYYRDFKIAMLESSKTGETPVKYCKRHCQGKLNVNDFWHKELKKEISNGNVDISIPLDVSMTIDNNCNLSCKMCWIFNDLNYKISEELATSSIDYIASLKLEQYSFTFLGGEPQYSTYEKTIIRYAINSGIHMSFISNFSIFDSDTFNSMKIGQFKGLNISTNSASNETRKLIMGDSFDKFYTNVDEFLWWRHNRMLQGETSQITMSFIIMTSNYHELINIIDLAYDLPVELQFVVLLHKLDGNYEEVFTIKPLQDDVMQKLNAAVAYLDDMLIAEDFNDTRIPCGAENIKDFKVRRINQTKRSLMPHINYLNDIMLNGPSFDAPLYDIEIKHKKINIINLL